MDTEKVDIGLGLGDLPNDFPIAVKHEEAGAAATVSKVSLLRSIFSHPMPDAWRATIVACEAAMVIGTGLTYWPGGSFQKSELAEIHLAPVEVSQGAHQAGSVFGLVTIDGKQSTTLRITGRDAEMFRLSDGGIAPCKLIAAVNVPDGDRQFNIEAK